MRRARSIAPWLLALSLTAAGCDATTVASDEMSPELEAVSLEVELDADRQPTFDLVSAGPLPFVPVTLAELRGASSGALGPDTEIVLRDGTRRRLDDALALLNEAERQVALSGSTLRGGVDGIGQPLPEVLGVDGVKAPVTYAARVDYAALAEQREELLRGLDAHPLPRVKLAGDLTNAEYHDLFDDDGGGGSVGQPFAHAEDPECVDEPFEAGDGYGLELGVEGSFAARLDASVHLSGDAAAARASAQAYAGGTVFGADFALIDVRSDFVGPHEGEGTGHVRVSILGEDLYDGDVGPGTLHQGAHAETLRAGVKIPIANLLGLVAVTARVGVEGRAGVRWVGATTDRFARIGLTPWASTSAFARIDAAARIDLGIAKAKLKVGVGGKLTFLEDSLVLMANAQENGGECLHYNWYYEGTNALRALSGKVDLHASANACVLGLCVGDRWHWNLFEWDGVGPFEAVIFADED